MKMEGRNLCRTGLLAKKGLSTCRLYVTIATVLMRFRQAVAEPDVLFIWPVH